MAFIAPGLVKAAVKGWLPPAALPSAQCEWSRQYERLGLAQPRLRGSRSNEPATKNAEIGRSARRNGIFGRGDRPPKRTRYRYRRPDTKKKVTGKAASRGLSSRVSGYLEISRLRGGCDRDRTCDPYHVKVGESNFPRSPCISVVSHSVENKSFLAFADCL
jgi:hypothetical protein